MKLSCLSPLILVPVILVPWIVLCGIVFSVPLLLVAARPLLQRRQESMPSMPVALAA
jgi:hypothetical protein